MTTTARKVKYNVPIPKWIPFVLIVVVAFIVLVLWLGAGNIVSGFGHIGYLMFVAPMEWGAINVYQGMAVILGLVVGTFIVAFLISKRRYLHAQTATVIEQTYQPRGVGVSSSSDLPYPEQVQVEKEETT